MTDSVGAPATPRLSAGAHISLDAGNVPLSELSRNNIPLKLSNAELSAEMDVNATMRGILVLDPDDGAETVNQALGIWSAGWGKLAFGQHRVSHGLYQGHLIHDPLLQQDVETILPGASAIVNQGPISYRLGLANHTHETDSGIDSGKTSGFPAAFPAIDVKWGANGIARISGEFSAHRRDIDLAATIPVGSVLIDLEGVAGDGEWAPSELAALAGLTWKPLEQLEFSTRYDARKPHGADWRNLVAFGGNWYFAEVALAGVEWAQDLDGKGKLTLRIGLQTNWDSHAR